MDLLRNYLQYPSYSFFEKKSGEFLLEQCRENGLHTQILHRSDSLFNFCASLLPLSSGKPNVVLLNHLDVVPIKDRSQWKAPPFSGQVCQGRIYGRGALDMKGPAAMQLLALSRAAEGLANPQQLPFNFTMLCVSGEEKGGKNGAEAVLKDHLQTLNPTVVFGEGGSGMDSLLQSHPGRTVFGVSVAEKKSLWLRLTLAFPTYGHGAVPTKNFPTGQMVRTLHRIEVDQRQLTIDPVSQQMFRTLGQHEKGARGFVLRHLHWRTFRPLLRKETHKNPFFRAMLANTAVLTRLETPSGPPNQIAQQVSATFDCRLLPSTTAEEFIAKLREKYLGPHWSIERLNHTPEAQPSEPGRFFRAAKHSLKAVYGPQTVVAPILFPATSDNSRFRNAGVKTFGILPLILSKTEIAMVHNTNESIAIKDYLRGIAVYEALIRRIAGQLSPKPEGAALHH